MIRKPAPYRIKQHLHDVNEAAAEERRLRELFAEIIGRWTVEDIAEAIHEVEQSKRAETRVLCRK